jgi:hypothetical protein
MCGASYSVRVSGAVEASAEASVLDADGVEELRPARRPVFVGVGAAGGTSTVTAARGAPSAAADSPADESAGSGAAGGVVDQPWDSQCLTERGWTRDWPALGW